MSNTAHGDIFGPRPSRWTNSWTPAHPHANEEWAIKESTFGCQSSTHLGDSLYARFIDKGYASPCGIETEVTD
jgi:hypothetical protein